VSRETREHTFLPAWRCFCIARAIPIQRSPFFHLAVRSAERRDGFGPASCVTTSKEPGESLSATPALMGYPAIPTARQARENQALPILSKLPRKRGRLQMVVVVDEFRDLCGKPIGGDVVSNIVDCN
jgi:hypothetical protein